MIEVINPGFFTTIQDEGRWGFRAYGLTAAGAMDRYAYRIANILVGNQENAAALEMTMLGGTFYFSRAAYISVCGADMEGKLNGKRIDNWSLSYVAAGSELSFSYARTGCRCYLAVLGGIDVPEVLGSRSTYVRAGIGGLQGRALTGRDSLRIGDISFVDIGKIDLHLESQYIPSYNDPINVRVLLGPQDYLFTAEGIQTLFTSTYTVTNEADRMGYRLEGPAICHAGKPDIISDALCPGAIQIPRHGRPIVMMADCQTTGGYAKVGVVIGPDLWKLAQAKPGDSIKFILCSENEAVAALREEEDSYSKIAEFRKKQYSLAGSSIYKKNFKITVDGKVYNVEIFAR